MIDNKKVRLGHKIHVNIFYGGTISYLTESMDYVINTTNDYESYQVLKRVAEETFDIKTEEG